MGMATTLQLGFPPVPHSITNPNVKRIDSLDVEGPMPFLTFIKIITVSFEPEGLQNYYNFYIQSWNSQNLNKPASDQSIIVERYRDFIKDLTINYTTLEERQFLSRIDFNDPYDLDIALGFYSNKLRELAQYYNNKRNDIRFSLIRNKLIGTDFGTERTIEELVLSFLKTLEDGKILYDYDVIKQNIEIEIEEMYDTYSLYFNQIPNTKIYDNKDLDYGQNIFLRTNSDLISSIFVGVSPALLNIKEADQLFDNKRLLTEKYLSTDFYFLSTGSTVSNILSGKLFSNVSNSSNFLNRYYPTTASTQHTEFLQTSREKGFFRPSNTTIVLVDGINGTFSFNVENLSPNSLYFFPDPSLIGRNGEVLTFIVDDSYLKKNVSSGQANNQPATTQYDTKYYGYVSKIDPNVQKGFDNIFDIGYIKDFKRDINGNLFGLFINDGNYEQTISLTTTPSVTSVLFNGYKFYDDTFGEGLAFNYFTTSPLSSYPETIISGLSTKTGGFTNFIPDLILNFGSFTKNKSLTAPTDSNLTTNYHIVENAYIMNGDLPYADPVSSDLSAFQSSPGPFYFTELLECGLFSSNPVQRALWEPTSPTLSSLSATFSASFREPQMNIIEGGWFLEDFPEYQIPSPFYYYDDTVLCPSQLENLSIPTLSGKLMVKNSSSKQILPILDALPYLNVIHSSPVIAQLVNKNNRFELATNTLIMETDNWVTIDNIKFDSGSFIDPKTNTYEIYHSSNQFDKISNRLKVENSVFFAKFSLTGTTSSNNFVLYPEIYKFDIINTQLSNIFPLINTDLTSFTIDAGNIRYISSDSPILGYDSQTDTFILSIILRDQNDMVMIRDLKFYLNPDVYFQSDSKLKPSSNDVSNIFGTETLTYFLSSSSIVTYQEELIL